MQGTSGTMSDKELDMLRHSFSLMAGAWTSLRTCCACLCASPQTAYPSRACLAANIRALHPLLRCGTQGGDNVQAGLFPHQLRELCVMAGLDPAASATHAIVEEMLQRKNAQGKISVDAALQVAAFFQVSVQVRAPGRPQPHVLQNPWQGAWHWHRAALLAPACLPPHFGQST